MQRCVRDPMLCLLHLRLEDGLIETDCGTERGCGMQFNISAGFDVVYWFLYWDEVWDGVWDRAPAVG
jgi:hypothetical protein